MRAGIRIGQLEKELEVELSPEEDDEKDEEDLFIFKIWKKQKKELPLESERVRNDWVVESF